MKLQIAAVFICTLTAVLLSSCSEDEINNNHEPAVDTSTFVYPFTNGSTWNYNRTLIFNDIRPDSIRHYFPQNPITGTGIVTILYDTTINGTTTKCILDSYTETNGTFNSRKYYIQTDTALLIFAYKLSGPSYILPDSKQNIFVSHSGKPIFINEPFHNLQNLFFDSSTDTLIIENPPIQTLKYPITTNKQWIYRISQTDTLYRKYINFTNINISIQSISCIKAQLHWSHIQNVEFYDYYSKYGKLKSDLFINDALVTNEFGITIGYVDIREVSNVTSFNIINP